MTNPTSATLSIESMTYAGTVRQKELETERAVS
ncbi:hypothetical protein RBLE17_21900 [Rhodobacteraceae bacterium LE17]|jgi:hypothetical protein|nr:hypothetical protein [Rhodobacteraceae bacterium LE17]